MGGCRPSRNHCHGSGGRRLAGLQRRRWMRRRARSTAGGIVRHDGRAREWRQQRGPDRCVGATGCRSRHRRRLGRGSSKRPGERRLPLGARRRDGRLGPVRLRRSVVQPRLCRAAVQVMQALARASSSTGVTGAVGDERRARGDPRCQRVRCPGTAVGARPGGVARDVRCHMPAGGSRSRGLARRDGGVDRGRDRPWRRCGAADPLSQPTAICRPAAADAESRR